MDPACTSLGASVALFKTRSEQEQAIQMASTLTDRPFWLAISDAEQEGEWRWADGTELESDALWNEHEPNDWHLGEDCAAMNWEGFARWIDIGCEHRMGFVCAVAN